MADDTPPQVPQGGDPIPDATKAVDTKKDAKGPTEARVLVSFGDHEANDVVAFSAKDLKTHVDAGRVDPTDEAVAYAKSLKKD